MKKASMYLLMGMMSLAFLGACSDDDNKAPATQTGAVGAGGGGGTTTPTTGNTIKVNGVYDGRILGDRPTWRWDNPLLRMKDLPSQFTLDIPGCYDTMQVPNNGVRYDAPNGVTLKQSDGHPGIAVLAPSSCHSTQAYISYVK